MAAPVLGRAPGGAEAWRPTGDEGEISRRGRGGRQAARLIVDEEPAVEALSQLDAAARVGAAVWATRDLDPAGAEPPRRKNCTMSRPPSQSRRPLQKLSLSSRNVRLTAP